MFPSGLFIASLLTELILHLPRLAHLFSYTFPLSLFTHLSLFLSITYPPPPLHFFSSFLSIFIVYLPFSRHLFPYFFFLFIPCSSSKHLSIFPSIFFFIGNSISFIHFNTLTFPFPKLIHLYLYTFRLYFPFHFHSLFTSPHTPFPLPFLSHCTNLPLTYTFSLYLPNIIAYPSLHTHLTAFLSCP